MKILSLLWSTLPKTHLLQKERSNFAASVLTSSSLGPRAINSRTSWIKCWHSMNSSISRTANKSSQTRSSSWLARVSSSRISRRTRSFTWLNWLKFPRQKQSSSKMRQACKWQTQHMQRKKTGCTRQLTTSCAPVSSVSTARSSSALATTRKLWPLHRLSRLSIGRIWRKDIRRCWQSSEAWRLHWLPLWAITAIRLSSIWRSVKSSRMPRLSKRCKWLVFSKTSWRRQDQKRERTRSTKEFLGLRSSRTWNLHRMTQFWIELWKKRVKHSSIRVKLYLLQQPIYPLATTRNASKFSFARRSFIWPSMWLSSFTQQHLKKLLLNLLSGLKNTFKKICAWEYFKSTFRMNQYLKQWGTEWFEIARMWNRFNKMKLISKKASNCCSKAKRLKVFAA